MTFSVSLCITGLYLSILAAFNFNPNGSDFNQDYLAAYSLFHNLPLYGSSLNDLARKIIGQINVTNYHPPTTALLFIPLIFFSISDAFSILTILTILSQTWIVYRITTEFNLKKNTRLILIGGMYVWYPIMHCIASGQFAVIIAAGIVESWVRLRRGQDVFAGGILAIMTGLKLFPGIFVVLFFCKKRWAALYSMAAIFILLNLITLTLSGWDAYSQYVYEVIPKDSNIFGGYLFNQSLYAFLRLWFTEGIHFNPLIQNYQYFLICNCIIIGLLLFRYFRFIYNESFDAVLCATIPLMLLLSPVTWGHILPVTLLPLGYLFYKGGTSKFIFGWLILLLFSIPDILLGNYVLNSYLPNKVPFQIALIFKGPFLGILMLFLISTSLDRYRKHNIKNSLT